MSRRNQLDADKSNLRGREQQRGGVEDDLEQDSRGSTIWILPQYLLLRHDRYLGVKVASVIIISEGALYAISAGNHIFHSAQLLIVTTFTHRSSQLK